jgi:RimJ/RimL family protein N-acetyltransferase
VLLFFNINTAGLEIFETEALLVRQFTSADTEDFFLLNSNEQVMRYIRPVKSRVDSDIFLNENLRHYEEYPGTGRWAVVEKSSGDIIGIFSILFLEQGTGKLHIGYALLPAYWGRGYATILLKAGLDHFFRHNEGEALYALTRKENVASEKVLLKCGFQLEKEFKEHEHLWKMESNR